MAEWAAMLWFLGALTHLCSVSQGRPATSGDATVYGGNDTIFCPNMSDKASQENTRYQYQLLRGDEQLHWVEVNSNHYNKYVKVLDSGEQSELHADVDGHLSFRLSQLAANSSGLYTCHVCVVFPPPSACKQNSTQLLVVETRSVAVKPTCPPQVDLKPDPTHTLFLVALGLVALYGLLLTPVTLILWKKSKSQTYDHDYINMRQFGRRRYNGVQHPPYPQKH
ncbi:uncharacterized protein si:dkey-1h24.6 [Engraulis encrasicolus]|uniref:uncharacterized protein si:dkey-1h24.6 n=1 Tax=Engraulis encrasicolus TaxID=184585 RepID=UPI002FCEF6B9